MWLHGVSVPSTPDSLNTGHHVLLVSKSHYAKVGTNCYYIRKKRKQLGQTRPIQSNFFSEFQGYAAPVQFERDRSDRLAAMFSTTTNIWTFLMKSANCHCRATDSSNINKSRRRTTKRDTETAEFKTETNSESYPLAYGRCYSRPEFQLQSEITFTDGTKTKRAAEHFGVQCCQKNGNYGFVQLLSRTCAVTASILCTIMSSKCSIKRSAERKGSTLCSSKQFPPKTLTCNQNFPAVQLTVMCDYTNRFANLHLRSVTFNRAKQMSYLRLW